MAAVTCTYAELALGVQVDRVKNLDSVSHTRACYIPQNRKQWHYVLWRSTPASIASCMWCVATNTPALKPEPAASNTVD